MGDRRFSRNGKGNPHRLIRRTRRLEWADYEAAVLRRFDVSIERTRAQLRDRMVLRRKIAAARHTLFCAAIVGLVGRGNQ